MTHYIDKDDLVSEIENLENTYKKCPTRNPYEEGLKVGRLIGYKDALHKIDTLEVKEVDSKDYDAINSKIDDSDISCNCRFCSVHTTCKYFNPEKESNVKHCLGGVPIQLKQRKESVVKEVDLESEMDKYFETMEVLEHENIFEDTFQRIAKHFYELGLKAKEK